MRPIVRGRLLPFVVWFSIATIGTAVLIALMA